MEVRVVRSPKRRKTVSARLEEGVLVVLLPARLNKAQEQHWVEQMRARFQRIPPPQESDTALQRRAQSLNRRYFEGQLRFSIEWVDNQRSRWGSCTPANASIRLNRQLQTFPNFVLDYVIIHELAHLIEGHHGPAFWRLVERFPDSQRAIGFLQGYQWGKNSSSTLEFGQLVQLDEASIAVDREN